jgi:hypothetical protein
MQEGLSGLSVGSGFGGSAVGVSVFAVAVAAMSVFSFV